MHWQVFNNTLPRLCYGEEFGEVMLSRLVSMKDRHTWAVTQSDVEDLFVQICRARIHRQLVVNGLSSNIETQIRQRLHSSVTDNRQRIWYCPWQSGSSTMERHWEADPDFTSDPYSEPDVDTYRTLLTDVLRTFLRQPRNFSPAVVRLWTARFLRGLLHKERTLWTQLGPLPMHRIGLRLIPSSVVVIARTALLLLAAS